MQIQFFNFSDISLRLTTLHSSGRCNNRQRGRAKILIFIFYFISFIIIFLFWEAGFGPLRPVPRKYDPVCFIANTLGYFITSGPLGELSEELVTQDKRKKGWRMNCDVGEATEGLENEL